MLDAAGTRARAERGFRLCEDRGLACRETHVACEYELAARAAHATRDLRDRHETAGAQISKQQADRCFASQFRRLFAVFPDPVDIDVRDEVIGVGALEDEYLDLFVSF